MERYAHSPRPKQGIPAQTYREHTVCVLRTARLNAARAARYYVGDVAAFRRAVASAAAWHDLGKLDDGKQAVLCCKQGGSLPFPRHEEAGIAHLLAQGDFAAAALVAAHHGGLFDGQTLGLRHRQKLPILGSDEEDVHKWLAANLAEITARHQAGGGPLGAPVKSQIPSAFTMRVALSCLADADHGDTARHYGNAVTTPRLEERWTERLRKLEGYATGKPKDTPRDRRRQRFFDACLEAEAETPVRACAAPVGSGKTLGVMAHLLRAAGDKGLRHVFVVLPFTNIVKQSVEEYRKALTLDGENPEAVVAELHHLADFADPDLRHLAALWRAPVIVTTAVAFFETMASHHPAALRKFHEVPGSAMFIDEAHAALPSHLWPVTWDWMREWTESWGGHLVLGSGSLFRFWEAPDFLKDGAWRPSVPDLVPANLNDEMQTAERERLVPRCEPGTLDSEGLCDRLQKPGSPRLAILNTIRSAANVASKLAERCGDDERMGLGERRVLHLSTALAPIHRAPVVEEIKRRLEKERDRDWTLVATSCVEAGLDFSFQTAYREASTVASLVQTGGRVRRNEEPWTGDLVSFQISGDDITPNPAFFKTADRVLRLVEAGDFARLTPSELLEIEFRQTLIGDFERLRDELLQLERGCRFPEVSKHYKVIEDQTVLALVDHALVERIEAFERVPFAEIVRASVRVRPIKAVVGLYQPIKVGRGQELFAWNKDFYDPLFLGFMVGRQVVDQVYREAGASV